GAWRPPRGRRTTTAAASAAASGTATATARRRVTRRGAGADRAATDRTRSRRSGGAASRASRSWATRSGCDMELLLELLEGAAQAGRAVGGRDAEDAGRRF